MKNKQARNDAPIPLELPCLALRPRLIDPPTLGEGGES
jgi:hypothetical protein